MFGWKRKKKEPVHAESGLRYAGPGETAPVQDGPGETLHSFDTNRGPLEMGETAMVLVTEEGNITIPYHLIDAWDNTGRQFRVWWSVPGEKQRDYVMACEPKLPPQTLAGSLHELIHKNTFEV